MEESFDYVAFLQLAVPFIILAVILYIIINLLSYLLTKDKKRIKEIQDYSAKNDIVYNEDGTSFLDFAEGFSLTHLKDGRHHEWNNEQYGKRGDIEFFIVENSYYTGSRNPSHNYNTLCLLKKTNLKMPYFYLKERFLYLSPSPDKGDICFSEDIAFTKKYILRSNNESEVKAFFDNSKRKFFLNNSYISDYEIEGIGDSLLIVYRDTLNIKDRMHLLETGIKILNSFK